MVDVTVGKLADTVGTSVERLLQQMADAGLPQTSPDDTVSDEEKQKLLAHLKSSQAAAAEEASTKKITLKRKTLSTLKAPSASGKKTVNVEVRKKRTYMKKADEDIQAQKELEEAQAAEQEAFEQAAEQPSSYLNDDIEMKRQAAAQARKEEEEKHRKEVEKAQQQKMTDGRRGVPDPAAAAPGPKGTLRKAAIPGVRKDDEEQDKLARKKKAGAKVPKQRGNQKKLNLNALSAVLDDDNSGRSIVKVEQARDNVRFDNRHGFQQPTEERKYTVELPASITVSELAQQMSVKAGEVIKVLMNMGTMATINEVIDQDTAQLVVEEMGHEFVLRSANEVEEQLVEEVTAADEGTLESRAPVVTVMGHVDHGKTSLLDYIRNSRVAAGEAGGITQHIGAYRVNTDHGEITFLDTPGHAAFTAMRARGAQTTDVVILVCAADDGVMPQTEEAVAHSKAAGVPMVVAVNKIDKEDADPDKVKNELSALEVIPEDWGGDVQFVPVSAHTGEGIEQLLDAVLLQSEMLELKAAPDLPASGVVIESRLDKGRGSVVTVLVQSGTLRKGEILLAGTQFGRVRAMIDDTGQEVESAGPSTPVEILGLDGVPNAGDEFLVVPDDRKAREVAEHRKQKEDEERQLRTQVRKMENLFADLEAGEKKVLPVFVKADVRGSLEAILSAMEELGNDEVEVNVVGSGVGGISESDINLCLTTGAIMLGFNVRAESSAKKLAEAEGVEVRYYSVIYNLLDEIKQALGGMLAPERIEEIVGIAEVRDVFRSPKFGQVAGCMVTEGTVFRNKPIRVLRDNVVIHEGDLDSLRRFKDDVAEVRNGTECGIGVRDYDVKVGDLIEVFDVTEVERTL
jgi:translation initiation factor IF-2